MEHSFCLTVDVAFKSGINETFKISISTSVANFEIVRTTKEFEEFHENVIKCKKFRGIDIPKLPSNLKHPNLDQHYKNYLKQMLHRTVFFGCKQTLNFLNPPKNIKQAMIELYEQLNKSSKLGELKKKGDKFKAFRSRYFVLYPSYILEYYENEISYRTPCNNPKGTIDLTLVQSILIHQDTKHPNSIKIVTNDRNWILQCYSENDRTQWMNAINQLIENTKNNGYIPECCIYHKNKRESELLVHGIMRNNYDREEFTDPSFKRILKICNKYYYTEIYH